MSILSFSLGELQAAFNQTKEVVVGSLLTEGFITEEQAEEILTDYAIVVHEKGMLGKTIDKILGRAERSTNITMVKLVRSAVPQKFADNPSLDDKPKVLHLVPPAKSEDKDKEDDE